jgi:hypothetical protein
VIASGFDDDEEEDLEDCFEEGNRIAEVVDERVVEGMIVFDPSVVTLKDDERCERYR